MTLSYSFLLLQNIVSSTTAMLFLVYLMEAYEVFQMGLKKLSSPMERKKENSDLDLTW